VTAPIRPLQWYLVHENGSTHCSFADKCLVLFEQPTYRVNERTVSPKDNKYPLHFEETQPSFETRAQKISWTHVFTVTIKYFCGFSISWWWWTGQISNLFKCEHAIKHPECDDFLITQFFLYKRCWGPIIQLTVASTARMNSISVEAMGPCAPEGRIRLCTYCFKVIIFSSLWLSWSYNSLGKQPIEPKTFPTSIY
jgi:hypothetical protein